MLCFDDDAALCHLLIAATAVPVDERGRWLRNLANKLERQASKKSKATARQRLHRRREAAGRVVLEVEVTFNPLSEALLADGRLQANEIDDPKAVARALEQVIELLPLRWNGHA